MYAILIRYTVSNFHHTMMRYNADFYKNEPPTNAPNNFPFEYYYTPEDEHEI